ncbi:DUF4817 domain-containing protein [Trichonephila inaurata madagascariensis]|uniref:DUF4817 domain-containing protein n=1 Tax=Trichonephila inaurata madagascariensis TaxID=2747483 RepID=A0A8X7BSC0_9ARAC|nr:DUF4817 domain-containing protein [Trichonephila inaurata madagascariensis]
MKKQKIWFQQDGATAYTSWCLMGILRELLPRRLLFLIGNITLDPKGSRLIYHLLIFFLWGHLKAQLHKHRLTTLQALNVAITHPVATIPPEMT